MKPDEIRGEDLSADDRRKALFSAIGLWKDRTDLPDTDPYVRELRSGDRLERIFHGQI